MKVDIKQSVLTPGERMKLHRMLRNQRKKGKVTGINRIPNSTKIEKYLKQVSKRLES